MKSKYILSAFIVLLFLFMGSFVVAETDVAVFQGQYYIGDEFQIGTYEFEFDVYDAKVGGNLEYSSRVNLTTGKWGQWYVELFGFSEALNNVSKDYFMEISIEGVPQGERRRVTQFDYLRKDVNERTSGSIVSEQSIAADTFAPSSASKELKFIDSSGGDWLNFAKDTPLFSDRNVTSVYLKSKDGVRPNAGISYYIDNEGKTVPWLWANVQTDTGGMVLLSDEGIVDPEKDHRVLGRFTGTALTLGSGDSLDIGAELVRGQDFIIFSDAVANKAFFVDSNNDYKTTINADLNVTGNSYLSSLLVDGKNVCLEDGTNCLPLNFTETDPVWNLEKGNYVLKSNLSYFSGDYNDLLNKPVIPIDTNTQLSEAEVDSFVTNNGYLTSFTETDPVWSNDKNSYYLKGEVDSLISEIPITDLSNYYTIIETNNLLSNKVSFPSIVSDIGVGENWIFRNGNTLGFSEARLGGFVDSKINAIPLDRYYLKGEVDSLIPSLDNYYSKSEVNSLIPSLSGYYTKDEADTIFSNYVLKNDLKYFSGDYNDLKNIPVIPVDTRLSDSEIAAMGYVKLDTNTQLTEAEVDSFVANNGYLTSFTESDPVWLSEKDRYYLKGEVDSLIPSLDNYYSKSEVDLISANLSQRISNLGGTDFSNYYTKAEVYNKFEVNSLIPSMNNYYTKAEVQDLVGSSSGSSGGSTDNVFYAYNSDNIYLGSSWTDIYFDSSIKKDSDYSFSVGSSEVKINKDSWYEVSFECSGDFYSGSKYEVSWRAILDGDEIPGSRSSSSHVDRRSGKSSTSLSFISEFKSGNILKIQAESSSSSKVYTLEDTCRLIIKDLSPTSDTGFFNASGVEASKFSLKSFSGSSPTKSQNLSNYYTISETDLMFRELQKKISKSQISTGATMAGDMFYAYLVNSFNIGTSWSNIKFDFEEKKDSSYSFLEGDSKIKIESSGWFNIDFDCTADARGNARYHIDWRMVVNGVEEPGTRAASYHRLTADGRDSASISVLKELSPNDILEFQAISDSDTAVVTVSNGCRLRIVQLVSEDETINESETISDILTITPTNEPLLPSAGDVYSDIETNDLKYYDGNEWKVFLFKGDIVESSPKVVSSNEETVKSTEKKEDKPKEVVKEKTNVENSSKNPVTEDNKKAQTENKTNVESSSNNSETNDNKKAQAETSSQSENGDTGEKPKEECQNVCQDVCTTEDVCENKCEDVESCKEVCEPVGNSGKEKCKDECKTEEVCKDVCEPVETCSKECEDLCGVPSELFDIRMDLEETVLENSSKLQAVVTYASFGTIPTPVDLTFEILNSKEEVVYYKKGGIVVTSEEIRRYDFFDLNLEPGEYEFVFTTLYNTDVKDKFKQKFVVKKKGVFKRISDWVRNIF